MLFFDIDGTLFDHKSAEKAGALGFLNQRRDFMSIPDEKFLEIWSGLNEKYYHLYIEGQLSFVEQRRSRIRELYDLVKLKLTDEEADIAFQDYMFHYKQAWKVYPDVVPCLTELCSRGLGIISNGDFHQQEEKLQQAGIRQYFSVFVTSGEIGYAKPDRRIFLEACTRAKKDPQACFYVGDSFETDVVGSTMAGMRGIWLNRDGLSAPTGFPASKIIKNLLLLPFYPEQS